MLARTYSASVIGIDAYLVEVEVNATGRGDMDMVSIVVLADQPIDLITKCHNHRQQQQFIGNHDQAEQKCSG